MTRTLLIATLAMLAGGCTTSLQTSRPAGGIAKGYTYQLPRLGYDVEITRVLTHCPDASDPALRFDTTAAATSRATPGETVVINYLKLANGMKSSDVTFKNHPNGMLQSVNLTVNDHTSDVVQQGVKAAVSIGKVAIGLPGGGMMAAGGTGQAPYLRCTKTARTALDGLPRQKNEVKTTEESAKKATKALADFDASHPESPRSAAIAAQASKLIAASRVASAALDEARAAVARSSSALTLLARHTLELDGHDPALSRLSAARDGKVKPGDLVEISVPLTGGREIAVPLDAQLAPDIANATGSGFAATVAGRSAVAAAIEQLKNEAGSTALADALHGLPDMEVQIVSAALTTQLADTTLPVSEACVAGAFDCGVLYRTPAPGRLRICWRPEGQEVTREECLRSMPTEKFVLYAEDRSVPQFGRLASLPFHNGTFTNNTLTAEFAEDGRIITASYKKPNSEVQAALDSLNEGIGGVTDLITYANGAQLRRLQEQKVINEALLGEQDSRAKLAPSEVEALTRQTALINAQIGLAEAQGRAQPSQVTEIDNERLLIEAQIKRAQKQLELRALQAKLAAPPEESEQK